MDGQFNLETPTGRAGRAFWRGGLGGAVRCVAARPNGAPQRRRPHHGCLGAGSEHRRLIRIKGENP